MLTRHESNADRRDLWAQIAAPLPASVVQWRQQGKPKARDGKFFAPFVAYIDAQFVRDRLDAVVPGEWDLTLELLPSLTANGDGESMDEPIAFKARLQILGVHREDVGAGKDYKTASTDAFKRASVRFGIGHELYTDYEIVWVQVDSDSKYAKPVEDPAHAWAKKVNRAATGSAPAVVRAERGETPRDSSRDVSQPAPAPTVAPELEAEVSCPKCGGKMWDNRMTKRNAKAPDFKCRTRTCDGVVWPPRAPRSEPDEGEIPTHRFDPSRGSTSYADARDPYDDDRELPF